MNSIFSFKDAVHDHLSIGFVRGCVACAQTEADLMLSKRAFVEAASIVSSDAVLVEFHPRISQNRVSGNPHRIGLMHTA